jgi:hypothetical protein
LEASPSEIFRGLRRRINDALEQVGINVPTVEYQQLIERTAYAATHGTSRSYFRTLKALETTPPRVNEEGWNRIDSGTETRKMRLHQGVPLVPSKSFHLYFAGLVLAGPIVAAGIVINLPPFFAAWWAGRWFPDEQNVIALWRLLIGAPLVAAWITAVVGVTSIAGHVWVTLAYAIVTMAALFLYYRVKKLLVAIVNAVCFPRGRELLLTFQKTILDALFDETA